MSELIERFESTLSEIKASNPDAELLVVTKKKPNEVIEEIYNHGHKSFAENYVQEWRDKYEALKDKEIDWHFIGQLQSNKVKYLVGKVALIHTVDNLKLLKEIQKRAEQNACVQNILIQISYDQDENRGGVSEENLKSLIEASNQLANVKLCGLMLVAPIFEGAKESKFYFAKLKNLLETTKPMLSTNQEDYKMLSMGMSGDYLDALAEGANLIRVGSSIVGARK